MKWGNGLWRHRPFRRLIAVRLASQAGDGTLQVAMASYVLFSPTDQPDAWSIFGILAVTLLPFSLIGPFVSVVLDRLPRRRIVVWVDASRCLISIGAATVVASGDRGLAPILFALLLVAMSLNRFAMAGLSAGLASTVNEDELLTASSVVQTIGPLSMLIGIALASGGRLAMAGMVNPNLADAALFCLAASVFAISVALGLRIPVRALGPGTGQLGPTLSRVLSELLDAMRHVGLAPIGFRRTPTSLVAPGMGAAGQPVQPATTTLGLRTDHEPEGVCEAADQLDGDATRGLQASVQLDSSRGSGSADLGRAGVRVEQIGRLALLTMAGQRFIFGFVFVATVLIFRNHFNGAKGLVAAMSGLTLWVGLTGLGFVLASVLVPVLVKRLRVRTSVVTLLIALGVVQVGFGTWITPWALAVNGFLIGLGTQSFKICIDTILQANVLEEYKGRVFVLFDMLFNLALVTSALLGALVLPSSGVLIIGFVLAGLGYLVLAGVFFAASAVIGAYGFDRGTVG